MLRLSRYVRMLDDLAKEEVSVKYTFFPHRDTWGFKLFVATMVFGGHGFLLWIVSKVISSEPHWRAEYTLPDVSCPNKNGFRAVGIYRAAQQQRRRMHLPDKSSYMVEIRDFESDGPIEYRGDFPRHWWKTG